MKKFFLCLFFLFSSTSACLAEEEPEYFQAATEEETSNFLKKIKIATCARFLKEYFLIKENDSWFVVQGLAHDMGLCVAQDLTKAKELYEKGYNMAPFFPNIPIRLALIYEFGPEELRDTRRASVLMKRSVLAAANFKDMKTRMKVINGLLNGQPIPASLQKQMDWLKETRKKSPEDRKKIAQELEQEGLADWRMVLLSKVLRASA